MSEYIVDGLYLYCAFTEYIESHRGERLHKIIVTVTYLLLRLTGSLMTLVFLPGIREISDRFFRVLVYINAVMFFSFHLVSWVSAIKKLAIADAIDDKAVGDKDGTQAGAVILPFVFVIMPCHREPDETLLDSVRAVLNADYPSQRLRFFLSFDGIENEDSFRYVVKELGADLIKSATPTATTTVEGVHTTISLFNHGGKVHCQSKALGLVKEYLASSHMDASKAFLLLVDSDTRVARNSLQVFAQISAPNKKGTLPVDAATCLLGTSDAGQTLISSLEEVDYLYHGLLTESVASSFGSVFCVSGTQTFVRLSTFLEICDTYFASQAARTANLYRYWQYILGDDRWLTQLLLKQTNGKSLLQLETRVLNETKSAGFREFRGLLSQRRRWLLACTSADVFANLDWQMLTQRTALWTYRMLSQTVRTPDMHGLSLGIILLRINDRSLQYIGLALCLGILCNWSILLWIGKRKRRTTILLFPLFIIGLPFFNMLVRTHAMMTIRERRWGGSRPVEESKRR